MKSINERVLIRLQEKNFQGQMVPIDHVADLKAEITEQYQQGLFAEEFYQERLQAIDFSLPDVRSPMQSILVVTFPQPQLRVKFHWQGKELTTIIPPTYLHYPVTNAEMLLRELLEPEGYHLLPALLPEKLLAVHSGLAYYGRNNICYVPGMGSFHRLMVFYSDLPCTSDHWQELKMLDRCHRCTTCMQSCPTQAITSDRFLLHAERCLTFLNEGKKDFPSWLQPQWHHCLVGCMNCQRVCPENRQLLNWFEDMAEFSSAETALILQGIPQQQLPAETMQKLAQLELLEYYELLPRNLGVLFDKFN